MENEFTEKQRERLKTLGVMPDWTFEKVIDLLLDRIEHPVHYKFDFNCESSYDGLDGLDDYDDD